MKLTDLQYSYPEELVAISPQHPSRVLWVDKGNFSEISMHELLDKIPAGDVLVINNTKVLKRRVFAGDLEILFLSEMSSNCWQVLFPAKKYKIGEIIELPLGARMTLIEKGRPQVVELDQKLDENYFNQVAELPLPPYIQKARGERHNIDADESWYQTAWAVSPGSFAAPTASLHFSTSDLNKLKQRGVQVVEITLHVGLGTFLPVSVGDLNDHKMHEEWFEISRAAWGVVESANRVWALGTTVVRALESMPAVFFEKNPQATSYTHKTNILIQPGYQFKVVDHLLTNFHQPESTLLALVAGFAGLEVVKKAYQFAIEKKFRLFSYGDLSVWNRR